METWDVTLTLSFFSPIKNNGWYCPVRLSAISVVGELVGVSTEPLSTNLKFKIWLQSTSMSPHYPCVTKHLYFPRGSFDMHHCRGSHFSEKLLCKRRVKRDDHIFWLLNCISWNKAFWNVSILYWPNFCHNYIQRTTKKKLSYCSKYYSRIKGIQLSPVKETQYSSY